MFFDATTSDILPSNSLVPQFIHFYPTGDGFDTAEHPKEPYQGFSSAAVQNSVLHTLALQATMFN